VSNIKINTNMQKTTFKLLLLLSILFTSISNAQLNEGFESGTIPAGWTQEFVSNTLTWTADTQNQNGTVTPRTGTYLGLFLTGDYGDVTKLVTPSMNLTAVTNPQLKFYFTNVNWVGDIDELRIFYKTSAAGPWVQIGPDYTSENTTWTEVSLLLPNPSADYYIAFEATSNWARGITLDDITVGPAPTCISPDAISASNITTTSVNLDWTHPIGTQTNFQYVIQAAGTGIPAGAGTPVTGLSVVNNTLSPATDYEAWVRADCGAGDFSTWRGPVNFRTATLVTCGTPVNTIYCYDDNDTTTWTFTSSTAGPLRITFNSGDIEECCDEISIYDGTNNSGTLLYQGNNAGDLTGLTFDSTTSSLFMEIDADSSVSCGDSSYSNQWNFTVVCATCVNPTATFTTPNNCPASTFNVVANITSLGSASSLTISDNQASTPQVVSSTGNVTFGPYAFGTNVVLTLTNNQDNSCVISSTSLTVAGCPPSNDDCIAPIVLTPGAVFASNPYTGNNVFSTDSSQSDPSCAFYGGQDVWFSVVVPASGSITIETAEDSGSPLLDTGIAVYSGTCAGLAEVDCDDDGATVGNYSLLSLTGRTPGETLLIRVWEFGGDIEGTFQISAYDASLSTSSFNNAAFRVYPNPVKDILNLSYTTEMSKVQVINMLGQVVIDRNMNATEGQINMSGLNSGAYIVNVTVGDTVKTIKVIKQ
jgi:hypothetical protein